MNRDTILKCLQTNNIDYKDVMEIIITYCREKGKKEDKITKLMSVLPNFPFIIQSMLKDCLNYFSVKFEINKVLDKQGNVIKYY